MKKINQTHLVPLFAVVFLLFSAGCPNGTLDKNEITRATDSLESEGEIADIPQRDKKIYCEATIKDDFDDSSLVVMLQQFKV